MSVVKTKRKQSSVEFEMVYLAVADSIDTLVENKFYINTLVEDKHKIFLATRCETLEKLTDLLLFYIKIANSIYPQCIAELEERRIAQDKAIGICFAILTNLQRIMTRLKIRDDKYTNDVGNVIKMINSLKAWRKSDNKFRESLNKN